GRSSHVRLPFISSYSSLLKLELIPITILEADAVERVFLTWVRTVVRLECTLHLAADLILLKRGIILLIPLLKHRFREVQADPPISEVTRQFERGDISTPTTNSFPK